MSPVKPESPAWPDAAHELQHLLALLEIEQEADRKRFEEELEAKSLAERVASGAALDRLSFSELRSIVGGRYRLRLSHASAVRRRVFQSGQPAMLAWRRDEAQWQRLAAIVVWASERELEAVVEEFPEFDESCELALWRRFDQSAYEDMRRALQLAIAAKDADFRWLRDGLLGYRSTSGVSSEIPPAASAAIDRAALNSSQRSAARLALGANPAALIHGPPGTGKTTATTAAIAACLAAGQSVLAVAPSNRAVDLLSERLHAAGLAVLRLGHPARVDETLHGLTLDGWLERSPEAPALARARRELERTLQEARRFRRNFGPRERSERAALREQARQLRTQLQQMEHAQLQALLSGARLVCCTLGALSAALPIDRRFDVVFLDEAAQALEPQAWIALLRAPRLVMAGDHCQLAPTVLCGEPQLAETLFEKAMKRQSVPAQLLTVQYRMRHAIALPSNEEFYGGQLQTDPAAEARLSPAAQIFQSPLIFIDTAGAELEEEQDEHSKSRRNPGEAQLLLSLLQLFAPEIQAAGLSAGLLTPYAAQAQLLRDGLRQRHADWKWISADTIDAFQGGERDWIALSLVRSNDRRETGFLADVRRMNVAMTRARRLLLVVGDSGTLAAHPFYQRLLERIQRYGDYRSAFEFIDW
ncbi:MAG: AAA family ATPase [Leptospirales bacterium]|nr:AAA family ATPase [Leptospirales bacterium]